MLFVAIFVTAIVIVGLSADRAGQPKQRRLLGFALLLVAIGVVPFLIDWQGTYTGDCLQAIYYAYLGTLFLFSYLRSEYCFLFRGIATVTEGICFPRWKGWVLVLGAALLTAAFQQIIMLWAASS